MTLASDSVVWSKQAVGDVDQSSNTAASTATTAAADAKLPDYAASPRPPTAASSRDTSRDSSPLLRPDGDSCPGSQTHVGRGTTPSSCADDYEGDGPPSGCTPPRLSAYKLDYEVTVSRGCCGSASKSVLKQISCQFGFGLHAILGATGSGKSSLLDVLSGRVSTKREVLLDGQRLPRNFKCVAGYVIQEDTVSSMLTVRENIAFSASLRLTSSNKDREERVAEIIDQLGLSKCADTRVGTPLRRGISGGERKRTSIAMEMITKPTVLFLDEPTTGLDSNTANSVMSFLKGFANNGTNVIFSIHQPRYSIYKLFDTVTLLSDGECLYHGLQKNVLQHLSACGYVCESHNNPSDFLLDVVNGGVAREKGAEFDLEIVVDNGKESLDNNVDENVSIIIGEDNELVNENLIQKSLLKFWHSSRAFSGLENNLQQIFNEYEYNQNKEISSNDQQKYTTSFLAQCAILSQRNWRTVWRNPHAFMTQIVTSLLLALIVGTIYFKIESHSTSAIQNRNGAFFFITMNFVFGNMAAVDIFIKERPLFVHETISGFYRISSYFLSKLFFDVIPMRSIPILVFSLISYYMIGLNTISSGKFFFFLLNVTMTSIAGTSVALTFSATCSEHTIGTLLTALIWTFMMVFSDLLVNISTIPVWLQPLKYFSIFKYSMNSALINELKDQSYQPLNATTGSVVYGNTYLENQRIAYTTCWDLWQNELALLLLSVCFLCVAYYKLSRINRAH